MRNRKIDRKTKQIVISVKLHTMVKLQAAKEGKSIKVFVDEILADFLVPNQ